MLPNIIFQGCPHLEKGISRYSSTAASIANHLLDPSPPQPDLSMGRNLPPSEFKPELGTVAGPGAGDDDGVDELAEIEENFARSKRR